MGTPAPQTSSETPEVAPADSEEKAADSKPATSWSKIASKSSESPAEPEQHQESNQRTVRDALEDYQQQLAKLTADLDDKVRFSRGPEPAASSAWRRQQA